MTDTHAATTETLPSGVKIIHTQVGTGANPTAADTVKVHYRGTLENGTEFDSSYKRNAPISFPLRGVIPAWTQGVQWFTTRESVEVDSPEPAVAGARAYY